MKYFIYFILAIISACLFLPASGTTEIRNAPLLIAIISLIIIYYIYRFLKLVAFTCKVKSNLRKNGFEIRKNRLFFANGNVIAENANEVLDIWLLIRKKSYYRYYFKDSSNIEMYKSSTAVSKSSKRGTIARGETNTRVVGRQRITRYPYETDKNVNYFVVFDKMPTSVADSARREELYIGDKICSSDVLLYDIKGFVNLIDSKK